MEEGKFTVTYNSIAGTRRSSNCTFCGRSRMVSDYFAGRYVIQACESCAENPPGMVDVVKVLEEKSEIKKKKK